MKNLGSPAVCPQASRHTAGSPCPVYVGGVLYRSIFEASVESGISTVWMLNRLKASKGAPVFIRGTAVVEQGWVRQVIASFFGSYSPAAAQGLVAEPLRKIKRGKK